MPFFEHKDLIVQSRREASALDFPLHMHVCPEFIYVAKGEILLHYPNKVFNIKEGDFAVIFPYTIHGYETLSDDTDYILAILRQDVCEDYYSVLFNNHPASPVVGGDRLSKEVPYFMQELVKLNGNEKAHRLIKAIASLILERIIPTLEIKPNTEKFNNNLIVRTVTYTHEHFKEPVCLDDIASYLGISRYSVSRIFSLHVKVKFTEYINFLRINYAKELLESTDKSILDICFLCGYNNLRSFNREFKRLCLYTPLNYRKQHQNS